MTLISTTWASMARAAGSSDDSSASLREAMMPAWRAAPRATTSLTANEWSGALPVSSRNICPVIGMCVEPPTRRMRST